MINTMNPLLIVVFVIAVALLIGILRTLFKGDTSKNEQPETETIIYKPPRIEPSISEPLILSKEETKGLSGEMELYNFVKGTEEAGAKVIWNCWLRWINGSITQADVVLIWKSGIYVIESKNYSKCMIFGSLGDEYWTRTSIDQLTNEKRKRRIINPVSQNMIHMNCISEILGDVRIPLYSVIAYSDCTELRKVPANMNRTVVVNYRNVKIAIANLVKSNPDRVSIETVNRAYQILKKCSDSVTEAEKAHHNSMIRSKYSD